MLKRIISAFIALLIFIPIVLYGKWPFSLLVYVMATIGLFELLRMKSLHEMLPIFFSFLFLWLLLLPDTVLQLFSTDFTKQDVLLLWVILLLMYTVLSENKFSIEHTGFILLASLYVGSGFYFLIVARSIGLQYILFILLTIWATDTGAYFVGNAVGRHKLWQAISPNKTIEGALGGIGSAAVVGSLFQYFSPFDDTFLKILLIAILISIMGQMGDLVASAFKRHFHVKDSGYIMPGHGGILDRMDSLIFVMIFLSVIQFI